jgi:Nif-specific regulatory protein
MNTIEIGAHLSFNGLSALYRIARVLSAGGTLAAIMENVLDCLETYAGMKRGMISIVNKENSQLAVDVARGISETSKQRGKYRIGEGITGKVVATGRPIAIPRLRNEPTFLDKTGARKNLQDTDLAFMCVPIKANDHVVGTMSVDKVAVEDAITLEGELRFLEAVADMIAQVVSARQREQERIAR